MITNIKKILTFLILLLAYIFLLSCFTRAFDYDLGWHLRFGRDIWESSSFPYQDTYTWGYQETWFNHEWGGDWFYWLIYSHFGYFPLLLILSIPIFFSVILCIKIFRPKIGLAEALITLLFVHALRHIMLPRLAMFMPMFTALIWYFLERLPKQKNYYFWPLLFWLWSVLHGSWILGFIIIGIYVGGNILNLICKKYYPRWYRPGQWGKKEIITAIIWSGISALAILINPYGWHIWQEVITYISASYYKTCITEWIPSYTFPVYAVPLFYMAVTLPLIVLAWFKKRVTWPQILIYAAFWIASFKYKRHALLFMLVAAPLLAVYADQIKQKFLEIKKIKKMFLNKKFAILVLSLGLVITCLFLARYSLKTKIIKNIWEDKPFLNNARMPVEAAQFLKQRIGDEKVNIFNSFNWGGYLEWTVPNAITYFDGRGCVSWMHSEKESMLEHYHKILFEAGGLKEIESLPVRYIILQLSNINNDGHGGQPDFINRLLFKQKKIQEIFSTEPSHLQKMVERSSLWELIYEDDRAKIWERVR